MMTVAAGMPRPHHVVVLSGVGLALGLALAFFVLRPVVASQLHGVSAADPWAYAGQCLVLLAAALLGCTLPARRAVRTDPARTLRAG